LEEVLPGLFEALDLLDVVFVESFDLATFTIVLPTLDVLELLLDRKNSSVPLGLELLDFGVSGLVLLEHVQGSAVLLELLNSEVKKFKELVEVLLGLFDQMDLNLHDQLAGALLLVISQVGVIQLDEETRSSAVFVGHLNHVVLHLFDGGSVVSNGVFGVSGLS
jgi:hypothetical protein